jgi:divalent metal cation (Fe/Co/Zn/Cd) transporter
VIGLVITVAILLVLRDAAREVYRRLMDAVEPVLVDQAEHAIGSVSRGRGRDRRPLAGARAQPPR